MAIRDRATVTLKTGEVFPIQVTKVGGELEVTLPRDFSSPKDLLEIKEVSQNGTVVRSLTVPAPEIRSLSRDVAPAEPAAELKHKARRKTPEPQGE